jgi:hypothetical protein
MLRSTLTVRNVNLDPYFCIVILISNIREMKITTTAIATIKKNLRLRNRLALELDKSGQTIDRWINTNESNGELTTLKALQVIKEETGLSDTEIIEESDRIAV